MKKNKSIFVPILSGLFSLFIIFGISYLIKGNWSLVFGSLLNFVLSFFGSLILFYLFSLILNWLFNKLDNLDIKESNKEPSKLGKLFDEHPFLFSLIVIIICWIPYIIAFYPIILSPDPSFQIKQFFGIPNKYSNYSILIDESVIITNHHPVIHTMLLGSCLKLGTLISNDNLGLFFYSIIQIIILSSSLAYTISYMKKIKTPKVFRIIALLIYALVPVFPFYAMSGVKDVIFGSLIIIYIILIYDYIKYKNVNIKRMLFTILIMLLICLFRNNGIFVIILSFPFLLFTCKKNIVKYIIIFVSVVGIYTIYDRVVLPYFKITATSIREGLSIPFQQTARLVKYHSEDMTEEDKKNIDKVLNYDTIAERYNPDLSDPVKNQFNKYSTTEDMKLYFKTWFNGLLKHPGTYIQATVNNTYGYFCPLKTSWYIYYKFKDTILEDGFDYHYNNLDGLRNVLKSYGLAFLYIPILGLLINIGFNTWLVMIMFCYLLHRKKYKYLCFLTPAVVLILVCIASPANAYFRYALPYIFALPITTALFINSINKDKTLQ